MEYEWDDSRSIMSNIRAPRLRGHDPRMTPLEAISLMERDGYMAQPFIAHVLARAIWSTFCNQWILISHFLIIGREEVIPYAGR